MSTIPFRTRVSSFDVIDGVWVAVLSPCNRCTVPGSTPNVHTIPLPFVPNPEGGEAKGKAPCATGKYDSLAKMRNAADGKRILIVWTPEIVARATHIDITLPDPDAPKRNNTIRRMARGDV